MQVKKSDHQDYCTVSRVFYVLAGCAVLFLSCPATAETGGPTGYAAMEGQGIHYLAGGTTGGAGGAVVTVLTYGNLAYYASQTAPYIIRIQGPLVFPTPTKITVKSNKTFIGAGNDAALINCGLNLNSVKNIIIKNLSFKDYYMMGDYDGKLNDYDCIALRNTHHVWIDHCHLSRAGDGLLDMTYASGYVTVSWTIFSHHNKTSIANGQESPLVAGTYTYDHCWFDNTTQRNAVMEWATVHAFNCYFLGVRSYCMNARRQTQLLLEHSYFKQSKSPYYEENGGQIQANGCILDNTTGLATAGGSSFVPPYSYTLDNASEVPAIVTAEAGPGGFINNRGDDTILINFMPYGKPEVRGYLSDYGYVYGNRGNGYRYGWDASNTANAFWRETLTTKEGESYTVPVDADFRRNSIITMANGSRKWEIELPNGQYYVRLMCGDAGDPRGITPANNILRTNRMIVEGVVVNDSDMQLLWDYDDYSLTANVTDERLTIEQYLGNYNAALCFVEIRPALAAVPAANPGPGLAYRYYEGNWDFLPDFNALTPVQQGAVANFDLSFVNSDVHDFGAVFEGYIDIPQDGLYTFSTYAIDGTRLFLGTTEVVDNDGVGGWQKCSGDILLKAGFHPIRLEMFMRNRFIYDFPITLYWAGPSFGECPIGREHLVREWIYGDFNGDWVLDTADLSIFMQFWLYENCIPTAHVDRNGDCTITLYEFSEFSKYWLSTRQYHER